MIALPRSASAVPLRARQAPTTLDREHVVSIVVAGTEIRGWTSYELASSMLDPSDHFSLEMPFTRAVWDRLKPDSPIKVRIDDVVIVDGFIDDREIGESDDSIRVAGRDRIGRLVQESAPGIYFGGGDLVSLVEKLSSPWFTRVTPDNARNRRVMQGKGRKARAGRESLWINTAKKAAARIEPGQTRWQAIEDLCHQAEILCWSAGDGRELVLGRPNYDQEPIFRFFMPESSSIRATEGNVLGLGYQESTGDRYSEIIVVGSGGGTDANYGASVAKRYGHVVDDADFTAPKRLVIQKAVVSSADAEAWARREMNRRNAQGTRVTVRAPRHGQIVSGQMPTIFAPDLLASIEDERTGLRGVFLIVSCTYRSNREGGEETLLEFVPKGQELAL